MSKLETPMTRWYWQSVGGTLVEEFCAVHRSRDCGNRVIDGIIIKGGLRRIAKTSEIAIEGEDIVIIQTKAERLGMYLMGQAFFSAQLMKAFKPRSIESVALVMQDDSVLRPRTEKRGKRKNGVKSKLLTFGSRAKAPSVSLIRNSESLSDAHLSSRSNS